jgi:hypothetical protein
MKKTFGISIVCLSLLLLAACTRQSSVCDTEPPDQPVEVRQSLYLENDLANPVEIRIRNRPVQINEIVHGFLCDAEWEGQVYVDCDVEVAPWDENPFFFDGCDLDIAPNTVVYVAYHNDTAYYQGCSCHFTDGE